MHAQVLPFFHDLSRSGRVKNPAERIQPELNFLKVSAKALRLRAAASIHCRNFAHDPFDEPVHIEEHIVGSRLAGLNHGLAFVRHDRPREG